VLAHGQQVLRFADDARAFAEDALFELLHLSFFVSFSFPFKSFSLSGNLTILDRPLVVTT
jgi:hypothetical protein